MRITQNERAAQKILDAVNDYTLDTYMIGFHIFQFAPLDLYVKLDEIMEGIDLAIEAENKRVEDKNEQRRQDAPF
jgi:hypothetical protein